MCLSHDESQLAVAFFVGLAEFCNCKRRADNFNEAISFALRNFFVAESADSRIIGGQTVRIEDFPYQVSLEQHGEQFCGGVIISNKHILTAGHCFSNIKESRWLDIINKEEHV